MFQAGTFAFSKLVAPSLLLLAAETAEKPNVQFSDITDQAGISFERISGDKATKSFLFEVKGGGGAFADIDGDGWMDLILIQGTTLRHWRESAPQQCSVYRNRKDGTFDDVSDRAGVLVRGWGMGVATADYDNDGDVDLYVTSYGPNTLYQNNGQGIFTDATQGAGLDAQNSRWSSSAAFADYDGDGDLDLYVTNYVDMGRGSLPAPECRYRGTQTVCGPRGMKGARDQFYRNNGNGTFSEVSRETGAFDENNRYGLGVAWGDLDNDGDQDLYVANDFGPNLLFMNQGDGSFQETAFLSGAALSGDGLNQAGMGIDIADSNNDGLLDIFVTHFASDYSTFYQNQGQSTFEDVTGRTGIQRSEWFLVSWGTHLVDVDADGWKDIFHSNGHVYPFLEDSHLSESYRQPSSLYRNRRDGTFEDMSHRAGAALQKNVLGRGSAVSDFDNDGDLDFFIINLEGKPLFLRNDTVGGGNWIMFRLQGRTSNRDAIGARLEILSGGMAQIWEIKRNSSIFSSSDPRAHFGLGTNTIVDLVKIRWPSGKIQTFHNIPANSHYLVDETTGLSRTKGLPRSDL